MTTYEIKIDSLRTTRTVRDDDASAAIHFLAKMEGFEVSGSHLVRRIFGAPMWAFDVVISGRRYLAEVTRTSR